MTLKELLRVQSAAKPKAPFIFFDKRRVTYGEFAASVYRVANGLLRSGVTKGDRLAVLLPNCPEFLSVVFAAVEIGAVFVPVNTAFTAEEVQYVIDHSESSFLITTAAFLSLVERIRVRCPTLRRVIAVEKARQTEVIEWQEFLHGVSESPPQIVIQPAEVASITYTSGTTDRPKGVMLTQFAYAFAPKMRAEALGWNEHDRAFVMMPLFHVNALCHMAVAIFSVGGSILLSEKFSASRFWDEVREYGVTTASLMRTIPQILLSLPDKADDAKNPLRLAVALLSPEQHLYFEERFNTMLVGSYSLTEDILSVLGPTDRSRRRLGSCGLPVAPAVHQLRIVNERGEPCQTAQIGEITKQSPAVMKGYYKRPDATREALRESWLYTGDLGYLDEDGFLYFVDRKKDMVKRSDENVSSEEVEQVLNSHPLIAESAVVGVSDPIRHEEVKAFIVLKQPATQEDLPPEAIWAHCRQQLAPFKIPRYLEYRMELPKTPSSKIQKHLLRKQSEASSKETFDRFEEEKKYR
ncbi:MAG TPA: AMP-binding protein [Candidatus Binatia bacterium]|nr:AMP-binding protein [Candidatus Binatia bacterium]